MGRNNCTNCWNRCGNYCTCHKDMNKAAYKKCEGWKEIKHKAKKPEYSIKKFIESKRNRIMKGSANIKELSSDFQDFIRKGGHYSCRTGKIGFQKMEA